MTVLQFLDIRFSALTASDYAAVYDSYHSEAPFLRQFSDRNTYILFAEQQLGAIEIKNWRCLQQRIIAEGQVEVLLLMELATEAGFQFFYELALLVGSDKCWYYHSAQKLGEDDYSGAPDQIEFHHFDNATQKIRF